ncbi:STAS domain-containing protein [Kitasatospora sp. NPDC001660]
MPPAPPERAARKTPASPGPARAVPADDALCDGRPARAGGEIDLATAPRLRCRLGAAFEAHGEVVLDLSEVTFMDCSGLGVLVQARHLADQYGGRLVLRGVGRPVAKLLKLTSLSRRLAASP